MLDSIIENFSIETEKTLKKKHMDTHLKKILEPIIKIFINRIYPFLYTIFAILIIMLITNCFQIYYIIRHYNITRYTDNIIQQSL